MTTIRGNFSNLLAPGIRNVIFGKYKERPEEYSKILNVGTSKRQYEEDTQVAGMGAVPLKGEGTATQYDDPAQGYKTTYTHLAYGLGFRVTQEMYDDDLYGVMNKMSKTLAISARNRIETSGAALLNNGFSTAHTTEGKALFATDHPLLKGGGSASNRLATDSDLGVTSLRDAIILMEKTPMENGMIANIIPKLLVVTPDDKFMARELLGSEWRPGNANNEINAFLDEDLVYFVNHYLTDSDAWFLGADKGETELHFLWRTKITFANDNDFDTGDAKYKIFFRFSYGWSDWRGWIGSPGA